MIHCSNHSFLEVAWQMFEREREMAKWEGVRENHAVIECNTTSQKVYQWEGWLSMCFRHRHLFLVKKIYLDTMVYIVSRYIFFTRNNACGFRMSEICHNGRENILFIKIIHFWLLTHSPYFQNIISRRLQITILSEMVIQLFSQYYSATCLNRTLNKQ